MAKTHSATIKFTSDPKYYEIGDTITIKLENGKIVTYTVTSIDKRKTSQQRHIQEYLAPLIERFVMREHAPLLKGLDRMAKEMLKAYLETTDNLIPLGQTVTVRFVPKIKITRKEV